MLVLKHSMPHSLWLLVLFTLSFAYHPVFAGMPTQFNSVADLFQDFNDYSPDNGTFKLLSVKPLHIQVSPLTVPRDFSDVIEEETKRSIIYSIYRSFIHTPVTSITVTAIPLEVDWKTRNKKYLYKYKKKVTITKAKALSLIRQYIGVSSFQDLVTIEKVGDLEFKDQWSNNFKRIFYDKRGTPGLTQFFKYLTR